MPKEKSDIKILVVDDVPQNIRLLELSLKAEGYQVIPAYDGEEALEKVKTNEPDLILLDVMMPGMDGYEVCRRLRSDKKTRTLPIVLITAYDKGLDKKLEAVDIGADDFIEKPFKRIEVLARVRSLLRVKMLQDELVIANQRMEDELNMAREVQQAFLPQGYPDITALEFSSDYIPTFLVGGDFFDIEKLSSGMVEVFISDVMGHGPQAAMITGVIKTLLTQLSTSLASPAYLLSQINERFHNLISASGLPMFVTAFCMLIDTNKGRCIFSSAGHPAPYLIKNNPASVEELSVEAGSALGMIPNALYENQEHELNNEDMLFFFTDGLPELMSRDNTQFGHGELMKAMFNNTHLSPQAFVEALKSAADAFADGLDLMDDMTLLTVKFKQPM